MKRGDESAVSPDLTGLDTEPFSVQEKVFIKQETEGKESECLVGQLLGPVQDFIKFKKNNGSAMLA